MANANVEALQQELARQDHELEELLRAIGAIDPRDIPSTFFAELDEACRPRVALSSPASPLDFHIGLRA